MKQQWALPSSGYQCPQQQKVHHVCCHYQVFLIIAITGKQGRAARHPLFKNKSQCRAAQITSATVNTLPSAESLELKQFWECSFIPLWPHHIHWHLCWLYLHGILSNSIPVVWSTGSTKWIQRNLGRGTLMGGARSTSIHKNKQYFNQLLFLSLCKQ